MSFSVYLDEDAQQDELVHILRQRGVQVSTVNQAGTQKWKDEEQLQYATSKGFVIFSYNIGDFCKIHGDCMRAGQHHAGILLTNQQRFHLGELSARILRVASKLSADEMKDRLEFLTNW